MTKLINDEEARRLSEQKKTTLQTLMSGVAQQPAPSTVPAPGSRIENPSGLSTDNNQDFLTNLISKPLTPEDVERRKRAATAVGAVGQLGNLISSYANLAGTTGGAAPMAIPGYQGPDIESWQDRAIKRQQEYASIMNGLSAQQWEQAFRQRQLEQSQQNWAAEQAQKERMHKDQMDFDREKFEEAKRQNQAELESLDAYRQGQVKANQTRADKTGNGRNGSSTPNNDTISAGDYEYTFNRREGNSATWKGMYQAIPKEWLSQLPYGEQVHYYDNNTDMIRKEQELIIRYAQENPEFMEEMMNKYPSVLTRKKVGEGDNAFDLNDDSIFDLTK